MEFRRVLFRSRPRPRAPADGGRSAAGAGGAVGSARRPGLSAVDGPRVRLIGKQVARLALQHAADRLQGAEPDPPDMPLLEQREVGFADADGGREILGHSLALLLTPLEISPDRPQVKPTFSAFTAT